jgi:hypothetical protein
MMLFLFVICLRRPTFVTTQKWAKSRPSGAGEADFPQILFEGARDHLACRLKAFMKCIAGRKSAENHDRLG